MKRHIRNKVKMNERWAEKKRLLRKQKAVEESEWVSEREREREKRTENLCELLFAKTFARVDYTLPTLTLLTLSLSLSLSLTLSFTPKKMFSSHVFYTNRTRHTAKQKKKKIEREREKIYFHCFFRSFLKLNFHLHDFISCSFHWRFIHDEIIWWEIRERKREWEKNVEIETP
jgi:hypothetical protein